MNQREEKTEQRQFGKEEYEMVHKLVYEYQDGSTQAGEELINSFGKFFTKYVSLIKFGKFNLLHFSTRSFVKLFIDNPKSRRLISPYFRYKMTGTQISSETVAMIVKIFESSTQEDVLQDLKIIFLTMCTKYKDTKPSFHAYINKNFHFYAYRYFEKMAKDPVGRNNSLSINTPIGHSSSCATQIELKDIIPDKQANVESDHTLDKLELHYNLKHSNIPVVENKGVNMYENNFLDTNWVNGITCGDIFESLTPFERKIIILWYMEKKTDTEIGETFGVCRGTINRRRRIAKEKLDKYLQDSNINIDF